MADSEPPIDSSIPQVLLFGHVGAGKSSLLAALMQAGTAQGETLRGEVQEASGRLAAVRDAVYRGTVLERSDTELTSYTIRLRLAQRYRRRSENARASRLLRPRRRELDPPSFLTARS